MNSLEQKELLRENEIRKLKLRLDEANARIVALEKELKETREKWMDALPGD